MFLCGINEDHSEFFSLQCFKSDLLFFWCGLVFVPFLHFFSLQVPFFFIFVYFYLYLYQHLYICLNFFVFVLQVLISSWQWDMNVFRTNYVFNYWLTFSNFQLDLDDLIVHKKSTSTISTNKAVKIKFVFVHFTYSYFQMFSLSSAAFASTGNYKVSKYQWIKMSSWLCFILHRLYFQGIQRVEINDWLRQTEDETLARSDFKVMSSTR